MRKDATWFLSAGGTACKPGTKPGGCLGYEIPDVLAHGSTELAASIGTWLRLSISFVSSTVSASINGTQVVSFTDENRTFTEGLAAIGSGWHLAAFDDFEAVEASR